MVLNIRNKRIVCETGLVFILWLISIVVSYPVFNRPLDEQHEWLSATTLVSLRSFETYGFWPALGTSLKGPFCFEFLDIDPRNLPFVYSQHPSFWLISPYLLLKTLNFIGIDLAVSVPFLQIYNLVFTRLISAVCVFFIFKKLCFLFVKIYKETQAAAIASIATFFWLFSPPVLYWTQNVYHEDQAHLTPSLILILIALCLDFEFDSLKRVQRILLFWVTFTACFSSYYGWILVPSIAAASAISSCYKGKRMIKIIASLQPLIYGLSAAVVMYIAQIVYLGAVSHTLYKFSIRTGTSSGLSLREAFSAIWYYTTFYFPAGLFNLVGGSAFVLLLILSILAFFVLFFRYVPFKVRALIPLIPVLLSPAAYIFLLREYAYVHEFAVLKLALPLVFLSVFSPLLIVANLGNDIKTRKRAGKSKHFYIAFILLVSTVFYIYFYVQPKFMELAREGSDFNQELGALVENNISEMDLPLSDSISVGIHPPQQQFYTRRFIYTLEDLTHLPEHQYDITTGQLIEWAYQGKANLEQLKEMRPVYIEYSDQLNESEVNSICKGHWQEIEETLQSRKLSVCKVDALKSHASLPK